MTHRFISASAAVLVAGLLIASPAGAVDIFSADFEPPAYSLGPIAGQNGWSNVGTVESSTALGTQALAVTLPPGDGPFHEAMQPLPNIPVLGQVVTVSADLRYGEAESVATSIPLFGDSGLIGQVYYDNGFFLGNTDEGTPVLSSADDAWHHIVWTLNFSALSMSASVDGTSLGSLPINNNIAPTQLNSFYFYVQGAASTSQTGYLDNVDITMTPEPSAIALILLTSGGMLVGRRR
ncbi:MAG TPA: PEP-CTERM sorting domain-containing protein [Tepidisphaeraceae bacterium]